MDALLQNMGSRPNDPEIIVAQQALAQNPDDIQLKHALGYAYLKAKYWQEGLEILQEIETLLPDNHTLINGIMVAAANLGKHELVTNYEQYFQGKGLLPSQFAMAMAMSFQKLQNRERALYYFELASQSSSLNIAINAHLQIRDYCSSRDLELGLKHAQKYAEITASNPDGIIKLANFQMKLDRFKQAEETLQPFYDKRDDNFGMQHFDPNFNYQIGNIYFGISQFDKCYQWLMITIDILSMKDRQGYMESYEQWIPYYQYLAGYCALNDQRYEQGYALLESRFELKEPFFGYKYLNKVSKSLHRLTSLDFPNNASILLIIEHGFGDIIQMLRYIPILEAMLERINGRLDILYPKSKAGISPLLHFYCKGKIINEDSIDPLEDLKHIYQGYIGQWSLPHLLIKEYPTPIPPLIYRASEQKIVKWRDQMNPYLRKINIGLSLTSADDNLRRRYPIIFTKAWLHPNIRFFIVQDVLDEGMDKFIKLHDDFVFFENGIKDFEDSAAILESCDLFIGVDSSMIHLAGTIGKESLFLSPTPETWRFPDRKLNGPNAMDSLWYPSLEIIRQPTHGDWESVSLIVLDKLQELLNHE